MSITGARGQDPASTVVLGLGNIGSAVAECLLAAGEDVIGVDPVEAARSGFETRTGAVTASSIDQVTLAPGANVFVVVRLAEEALDVLAGLAARSSDVVVFVLTTLDIDSAARLADDWGPMRVIELPVSGGRQGALDGTLTALAAGPLRAVDREFLGRTIAGHLIEFDGFGQPTAAKLHNNVLAALHAVAHARVLELAAAHGVDPVRFSELVAQGSGGSWMGANIAVVVDSLLVKDVELYERCFGELAPLVLTDDGGIAVALERARSLLSPRSRTEPR